MTTEAKVRPPGGARRAGTVCPSREAWIALERVVSQEAKGTNKF